jgi:hypothetical protein
LRALAHTSALRRERDVSLRSPAGTASDVPLMLLYTRPMLAKAVATLLAMFAFVPAAGATLAPPSQPGPWRQIGKAPTSRIGVALHFARSAVGMKALAFVVASRSPRRIHVSWSSYCEFNSDDDYTESYSGKLSGVGRITYYPHVFEGATHCDLSVNVVAIKGARVVAGVFSH